MSCMVYGCTNNSLTSESSIKYYPFPRSAYAQKWIEACGWQSNTLFLDTACICSIHFDETAFESKIERVDSMAYSYSKSLKSDAVPTLYLPESQIVIKDNSMDVTDQVVVYTINSGSNDSITSISLENGIAGKQIFEIRPSVEEIKIETQTMPLKNEILDQSEENDHNKSYPHLKIAQGQNKSLKRKVATLESELEQLKNDLSEKEKEYAEFETECKNLEMEITNMKTFSQKDQETLLSKVFSEAQIKILFGKKKVYWSNDDMAVGYIIRHLSNKRCYNYLSKTLNIPLPGLSSIKRWVTAKKTKRIRR